MNYKLICLFLILSLSSCKDNYPVELRNLLDQKTHVVDSISLRYNEITRELEHQVEIKQIEGYAAYDLQIKAEKYKIEEAQAKINVEMALINDEIELAKKYGKTEEVKRFEQLKKDIANDQKIRQDALNDLKKEQ